MRDLYRRGSGMTLRRLFVLMRALPWDGEFKSSLREAYEKSLKPSVDRLRERQAHYDRLRAERGET